MTSPGSKGMLSRRCVLALAGGSVAAVASQPGRNALRAETGRSMPSRGFNLPGWFDRADGIAPAVTVLGMLRRAGFETVRLPVDGALVLNGGAVMLRRVREGIATLIEAGFAVLLDLHPSHALHAALLQDLAEGGAAVVRVWTDLRAVVADLPADAVFPELLNEPPMQQALWLALRDRLAATLRATCPHHTLVWGPAVDQGIWRLNDTPPLADGNQIAAVHFYAPMGFTHQCQGWGISPLARISGLPFPATREIPQVRARIAALRENGDEEAAALIEAQLITPWTVKAIDMEFGRAARWSRTQGCPVMLNEFGVLNGCVAAESRRAWVRAVRKAAERNGIGWTYWELDQGFGFLRSRLHAEGLDQAMIAALLGGDGD